MSIKAICILQFSSQTNKLFLNNKTNKNKTKQNKTNKKQKKNKKQTNKQKKKKKKQNKKHSDDVDFLKVQSQVGNHTLIVNQQCTVRKILCDCDYLLMLIINSWFILYVLCRWNALL